MSQPPSTTAALVRETYFPTCIYFRDIAESAALNAAIKPHIYAWRTLDRDGIERSNVRATAAWHSQLDMHRRDEYGVLVDHVLSAAQEIFADLGYDPTYEPAIDNMWANINPRNAYNRGHLHPNVLWSGVYYVQAPPNAGRIYFSDPRVQAQTFTPRYAAGVPRKREVWSEVYFEPIEGRIILFPGWLLHAVEPNLAEGEQPAGDRISASFNLCQRPRQSEG